MVRLFIGNIPPRTTEDDLRAVFEAHGRVDCAVVVVDHFRGSFRHRFGFVDMPDRRRANAAIEELNGLDIRGHRLEVCEAGSWEDDSWSWPSEAAFTRLASRQVA